MRNGFGIQELIIHRDLLETVEKRKNRRGIKGKRNKSPKCIDWVKTHRNIYTIINKGNLGTNLNFRN